MAPSRKRKRDDNVTCQTCLTSRIPSRFPDATPTTKCNHSVNTCKGCLRDYIKVRLSDAANGGIPCPECSEIMGQDGIEPVSSKKTLQEFSKLERRRVANETPGWFWCLNPKCNSGQVHPVLLEQHQKAEGTVSTKKARTRSKPAPEIFTCADCGTKSCVLCSRSWHQGETCEGYARRTGGAHFAEEQKSQKMVDKISKKCPNCQRPTIKNGGCEHMTCSQCNKNWCWSCAGLYTNGACKCTKKMNDAERRRQVGIMQAHGHQIPYEAPRELPREAPREIPMIQALRLVAERERADAQRDGMGRMNNPVVIDLEDDEPFAAPGIPQGPAPAPEPAPPRRMALPRLRRVDGMYGPQRGQAQ